MFRNQPRERMIVSAPRSLSAWSGVFRDGSFSNTAPPRRAGLGRTVSGAFCSGFQTFHHPGKPLFLTHMLHTLNSSQLFK
jgi:hypothetical protein